MADLGAGTYGAVKKAEMAVKRYKSQGFLINWDVLNEASIIRYLNEHQILGVPMLYRMSSRLEGSEDEMKTVTEARMTLGGHDLQNMLEPLNFQQTCNLLMVYLDGILNVVMAMHDVGVVHNDLKLNNILIDGSRVMIVDYGLADFDGHINENSPYHQYYVPERYANTVCRVSNDIWLLGAFIANMCLDKANSNKFLPIMQFSVRDINDFLPKGITKEDMRLIHKGTSTKSIGVILPKSIPDPLRKTLSGMLNLNPKFRSFQSEVIYDPEVPSGIFSRNYIPEYEPYLSEFLNYASQWWDLNSANRHLLSADNLVIGINILHRCLTLPLYDYPAQVVGLAIYVLVVGPLTSQDMGIFLAQILNGDIEYTDAFDLSIKILNHLNWKILTPENTTVLTLWMDSEDLIQTVRENAVKIINMNPRSLARYLSES